MRVSHDHYTGAPMVDLGEYYVKGSSLYSNDHSCYYNLVHHRGNFTVPADLRARAYDALKMLENNPI